MDGITESVLFFHGKKDGYEDSVEYLETINFVVEERYPEANAFFVKRMVLRGQLRDEALRWYQQYASKITRNGKHPIRCSWLLVSIRTPERTRPQIAPFGVVGFFQAFL